MNVAQSAHPLSAFGLDMLARGAARLRGARVALDETGDGAADAPLLYSEFDRLAAGFAARARECALEPGDRALILGANRIAVVVALVGALAAGLEPIVAPAHAQVEELSTLARAAGATALFGPMRYGQSDWEPLMFEAAAAALDVRIVGALSGEPGDAIDFSRAALEAAAGPTALAQGAAPRIGLADLASGAGPHIVWRAQNEFVAEGLDLVARLGLSSDAPILCALSPASRAGLAAGPVAALLTGAPLHLVGPFEGAHIMALADRLQRFHLVAPAAALDDFAEAGLLERALSLALGGDAPAACLAHFDRPVVRLTPAR